MFTIEAEDGKARVGILSNKGRKVDTPMFMPVATKAVGRFVSSDDYKLTNSQAIIANAFLLSQHPGLETFDKMKGIHLFMGFNGFIFTDCGGFQMLRKNLLEGTTNNGIWFQSPEGKKVFVRSETVMNIAESIDADVAMALDCVLPYGLEKEAYEKALVKSHKWTKKCKDLHKGNRLLFGITQGGTFLDLREESAKFINSLDFDGNAIGGVAIGEFTDKMYEVIDVSVKHLDKNKPRYVMGVGRPDQIVECVARGVDCFDSIYPQKNARHGMLFTFNGYMDLGKVGYKFDENAIDESCSCFTCKNFSRAYLRYLLKKEDPVGKRYLTIHNMFFMQRLMKRIRKEITQGTFEKFRKEFVSNYKKI